MLARSACSDIYRPCTLLDGVKTLVQEEIGVKPETPKEAQLVCILELLSSRHFPRLQKEWLEKIPARALYYLKRQGHSFGHLSRARSKKARVLTALLLTEVISEPTFRSLLNPHISLEQLWDALKQIRGLC